MVPLCRILRGYPGLSASIFELANYPTSVINSLLENLEALEAKESIELINNLTLGGAFTERGKEWQSAMDLLYNRYQSVVNVLHDQPINNKQPDVVDDFELDIPLDMNNLDSLR